MNIIKTDKICNLINREAFLQFNQNNIWTPPCNFYPRNIKLKSINLNNYFEELEEQRQIMYDMREIFCQNCCLEKNKDFIPKFQPKQLELNFKMATACNLSCHYCYCRDSKRVKETPTFTQNKEIVEQIISNPFIDQIYCGAAGEFYINEYLMKLCLDWKEKYGIKIRICSNLLYYDSAYPIDVLRFTWHKHANYNNMKQNVSKISKHLFPVEVKLILDKNKNSWNIDEVFNLIKYNLSPRNFILVFSELFEVETAKQYSIEELLKLKEKLIKIGFNEKNTKFEHYNNRILKGEKNASLLFHE